MPVESSPPQGSSDQDGASVAELGEQHNWQTYEFRRHEPLLEKLVRIRELRLLTLWQRDEIRLFIGIGRDGIAGLNLSTAKKKKRGSRNGSKRDLRPVVFDPYRDSRPSIP